VGRNANPSLLASWRDMKQEKKEEYRADYAGGTPSTFRRTRRGLGGTADAHYGGSDARYFTMMEYVRDMDRNDFLVGQIVDRLVDNIIRNGSDLEVQTKDKALNKAIWEDHQDWANDKERCDHAGRYTFSEKERLVLRHRYIDGDTITFMTPEAKLQTIEGDCIRTPNSSIKNIVHGVELDKIGRRVRYYLVEDRSKIMPRLHRVANVKDTKPIDAYDEDGELQVFHNLKPSRLSQTRGVTAFHAVFDLAGQVEDVQFAEVVRRQAVASVSWAIEREMGSMPSDTQGGSRDVNTVEGYEQVLEKIAAGVVLRLPPGHKASVLSSNIPGDSFFQHFKLLVQAIGAAVNMPLILVTLNSAESSWSSARVDLDQAHLSFICEQQHQFRQFNQPVHRARLRHRLLDNDALGEMLRRERELNGDTVFRHEWHGARWAYIQPLQDANANAVRLQTAQTSLRRFHAEIGGDFETFIEENTEDIAKWMDKAAQEWTKFVATYPELKSQVTLHDFYYRDFVRGAQLIDTADTPNNSKESKAAKAS
jgi:lambda family phage portal protein